MSNNFQTFHRVTTADTGKTYTLGAPDTPKLYAVRFETGVLYPSTGKIEYPSQYNYRTPGVTSHEFFIEEDTAKHYGIIPPARNEEPVEPSPIEELFLQLLDQLDIPTRSEIPQIG